MDVEICIEDVSAFSVVRLSLSKIMIFSSWKTLLVFEFDNIGNGGRRCVSLF